MSDPNESEPQGAQQKTPDVAAIATVLRNLAAEIDKLATDGIASGHLQQTPYLVLKTRTTHFAYGDDGVTASTEGGTIQKAAWWQAQYRLADLIKNTEEYRQAVELTGNQALVNTFADVTATERLDSGRAPDVTRLIDIAQKECNGEPVWQGADICLQGIILQPTEINLELPQYTVHLRQTKAADLEKETPAILPEMAGAAPYPTAIMRLRFLEPGPFNIQKNVEKALSLLRLFRVASVQYLSYQMSTETLANRWIASGRLGAGTRSTPLETTIVRHGEQERLRIFWETLLSRLTPLPILLSGNESPTWLTIAYQRYIDALMTNGFLERRMANAIMGLESIYMKEKDIVNYRIAQRVSRVFGLLGYRAIEVRHQIAHGYDFRSAFAHGDMLSPQKTKEIVNTHGSVEALLRRILDYLRLSIIIALLRRTPNEPTLAADLEQTRRCIASIRTGTCLRGS
jgi:hypothetical protein